MVPSSLKAYASSSHRQPSSAYGEVLERDHDPCTTSHSCKIADQIRVAGSLRFRTNGQSMLYAIAPSPEGGATVLIVAVHLGGIPFVDIPVGGGQAMDPRSGPCFCN
jgi:hypothetical protein